MLKPDCLEQEGHLAKWRRLASGEVPAGFAIYASFGTTHTLPLDNMLLRFAVACSLSTLTSSRRTEYQGMPADV